jgi:DNA-binding response OmpR family regulator
MKKTILVVDIGPRCYLQLRRKLLANNYEVRHASNLDDAVRHFDMKMADLLVVDLDLPAQQVCADLIRVSRLNPGLRVIGVTERSEGSEIALRAGLNGVVEKPIALGNLLAFIEDLLREKSPWAEFRYLPPRTAGLRERVHQRTYALSGYPAAYSGWASTNEHERPTTCANKRNTSGTATIRGQS